MIIVNRECTKGPELTNVVSLQYNGRNEEAVNQTRCLSHVEGSDCHFYAVVPSHIWVSFFGCVWEGALYILFLRLVSFTFVFLTMVIGDALL